MVPDPLVFASQPYKPGKAENCMTQRSLDQGKGVEGILKAESREKCIKMEHILLVSPKKRDSWEGTVTNQMYGSIH